jgi:predicted  nucleic acid-binding Zn-ribbon protein
MAAADELITGTLPGTGSFRCEECGFVVSLAAEDALPTCPGCGGESFVRASLFTTARFDPVAETEEMPEWVEEARGRCDEPGLYLVYREDDELVVTPLTQEWTRVGRSLAADIRFDDPTVSRRHALIVRQADGVRVLDDRSLNGVFVNGERVEWSTLSDADEILVGRHELRFLDMRTAVASERAAAVAETTIS